MEKADPLARNGLTSPAASNSLTAFEASRVCGRHRPQSRKSARALAIFGLIFEYSFEQRFRF